VTLAEALSLVDLRPGQTYREKVNGWTVEVRVLEQAPSPELAEQVMLQPWVAFPFKASRTLIARSGVPHLPKPVILDESDLAPE
jgi:hypothetical protein